MVNFLSFYPDVDVILGGVFSRKYNRPFFPPVSKPILMTDNSKVLLHRDKSRIKIIFIINEIFRYICNNKEGEKK